MRSQHKSKNLPMSPFVCPAFPQSIRSCVQNLHMSAPLCVQNITGGLPGKQTVQWLTTYVNCHSQERDASQLAVTTDHWLLTTGYWPLATARWLLPAGYCTLATDFWPLTTDHWPLTSYYCHMTTDYWPLTTDGLDGGPLGQFKVQEVCLQNHSRMRMVI